MTIPNILRRAIAGDIADTRTIRIDGLDGLDEVTVIRAYVWRGDDDPVELTVTILDADERTVTLELGDWLATVAVEDNWSLEFEVDDSAGSTLTWPENPAILPVRAAGH